MPLKMVVVMIKDGRSLKYIVHCDIMFMVFNILTKSLKEKQGDPTHWLKMNDAWTCVWNIIWIALWHCCIFNVHSKLCFCSTTLVRRILRLKGGIWRILIGICISNYTWVGLILTFAYSSTRTHVHSCACNHDSLFPDMCDVLEGLGWSL